MIYTALKKELSPRQHWIDSPTRQVTFHTHLIKWKNNERLSSEKWKRNNYERKQLQSNTGTKINMKSHSNREKTRKMFFVYLSSKHSEQQTLFKNAILLFEDTIPDYLHPHKKAITHNTPCQEGMLLGGGRVGRRGCSDIWYCCYHDNHTGMVPCTM